MKVMVCNSGNVALRGTDGRTVAVVDPSDGRVLYWDRSVSRSSVELHARDYLDDRSRGLKWERYESSNN